MTDPKDTPTDPKVARETDQEIDKVDEAGDETFPASDPPSYTPQHPGEPDRTRGDEKK